MKSVIYNGVVVNDGDSFEGFVVIEGSLIVQIGRGCYEKQSGVTLIDAKGGYIMPGVIDDQVHFRDPGLTYKADMESESRAAVAGGVTSFMDMPNTVPQTTTREFWEAKMERAALVSVANYAFFMGATNDNIKVIERLDSKLFPGVKVFMGSSTGGMLVDNRKRLEAIFAESPVLVATHCEDEGIIRHNIEKYGAEATIGMHPVIRSEEACYRSSATAVEIAAKYGTRLHVLHLSTVRELSLFESRPLVEKKITNEVCVHHLWFSDRDYERKGNLIKWNPAVKSEANRDGLRAGLRSGGVDIVATDHAPHTLEEKQLPYTQAPSGGPMVQHSLVAMLEMFEPTEVVDYMSHRVAQCFGVDKRGYLREGYFADVVVVERGEWEVTRESVLYKCGWSPMEGVSFKHKVSHTFVGGQHVYDNGVIDTEARGEALIFGN